MKASRVPRFSTIPESKSVGLEPILSLTLLVHTFKGSL
jgi:hypothetical protein